MKKKKKKKMSEKQNKVKLNFAEIAAFYFSLCAARKEIEK